jgi:hypothetical protein
MFVKKYGLDGGQVETIKMVPVYQGSTEPQPEGWGE